ncbi:MAG: filamentous hemagglutinin N-terminal domain-containing protein, partial [Planctomycetota bacterium]
MKRVRKISKKYYLRQIMACWLACYMFFGMPIQIARAAPTGGTFKEGGTGTIIDGVQDSSVTVNQAVSFIDWDSFDTSSIESVTFLQGLMSNSAVLNKIKSGNTTYFDGLLSAVDMRIFLLNPAGIIFGEGSSVNANQLVASSMKMTNNAFEDAVAGGDLVFTNPSSYSGARIVANYGTINAADSVYLVGKNVLNAGTIITNPGGLVAMVAGDEMTLGQPGSPTIVKTLKVNHIENHTTDNGAIGGTNSNLYDQFGIDASSNTGTVSTGELVLAAGDVWSNAVENVQDLTAVARGDIHFEEAINITGDLKAQAGLPTYYDSELDYLGKYKHDPEDYFSTRHYEEQGVLVKQGGDVHAKGTIDAGGSIDVLANGIQLDADVSAGPDADDNMTLTGRWGEDPIDGFHDIVTAGLTAGGNIDISVTGVTDQKTWEPGDWEWEWTGLFSGRWVHTGEWVGNPTPTYEPGTITLNGDVAAIAGNLTISNITDVTVPATLSAGTDLVLKNSSDPYENAETLTGTSSLTLAAGNEIQADNTTISVTGSSL